MTMVTKGRHEMDYSGILESSRSSWVPFVDARNSDLALKLSSNPSTVITRCPVLTKLLRQQALHHTQSHTRAPAAAA